MGKGSLLHATRYGGHYILRFMGAIRTFLRRCLVVEYKTMEFDEINRIFYIEDGKLFRICQGARWGFGPMEVKSEANTSSGHVHVRCGRTVYMYHRIVWLLTHGSIDNFSVVDHINGDPEDNRIDNLRMTTQRVNSQNRDVHRAGKRCGCSFSAKEKKWKAKLSVGKRVVSLGTFKSESAAVEVYEKALQMLSDGVSLDDIQLQASPDMGRKYVYNGSVSYDKGRNRFRAKFRKKYKDFKDAGEAQQWLKEMNDAAKM